jgi:hypothetical protein
MFALTTLEKIAGDETNNVMFSRTTKNIEQVSVVT